MIKIANEKVWQTGRIDNVKKPMISIYQVKGSGDTPREKNNVLGKLNCLPRKGGGGGGGAGVGGVGEWAEIIKTGA